MTIHFYWHNVQVQPPFAFDILNLLDSRDGMGYSAGPLRKILGMECPTISTVCMAETFGPHGPMNGTLESGPSRSSKYGWT